MTPIDNKYTRWYNNLVSSRKHQLVSKDTQCHHIIPRCLGGDDNPNNLVNLTLREHFIAHLLLSKMYKGLASHKMSFALRQMLGSYTPPTSRAYHAIKALANSATSALWDDNEWAEKQRSKMKELGKRPEIKEMRRANMIEVWKRPEYREKHTAAMEKVCADPEWQERNSQAQIKSWKDLIVRENRLKNRKPHSEEVRSIQSAASTESNKRSWADPEVRARRIAGIKAAAAKRKAAQGGSD